MAQAKAEKNEVILESNLEKLIPMVLDMDTKGQIMSDLAEEIADLNEKVNTLRNRMARIEAEHTEINGEVFRVARIEHKEWFRKCRESKLCIHVEKIKDEEAVRTLGLKLIAHDMSPIHHIREILGGRPPDDIEDGST